ncbi:hypothetical protein ACFT0E_17730, partial [Streptomyces sp. NPDC057052]
AQRGAPRYARQRRPGTAAAVEAPARAPRLPGSEHEHLFHAAGPVPPGQGTVPAHITRLERRLSEALGRTAW